MVKTVLLILLILQSAQPKAVLIGPSKVKPGKLFILKTVGTVGSDPKITCSPDSDEWQAVRFLDNSFGVMGAFSQPGQYTFSLAVNSSEKTDLATLTIVVGDPKPEPEPEPEPNDLVSSLQSAFKADGSDKSKLDLLIGAYKEAETTVIPASKTLQNVEDGLRAALRTLLGDPTKVLPNTRKAIGAYFLQQFGKDPSQGFDPAMMTAHFQTVADALSKIK